MRWTSNNKKAYLWIKSVQTVLSLIFLAVTIYLLTKWQGTKPNHGMMFAVRGCLVIHTFDLMTYFCDYVMIIKRWKFFIAARHILCCISVTMGIIVQIWYVEHVMIASTDALLVQLEDNVMKLLTGTILYIYQTYVIWAILNLIIYF